MVFTLNTKTLSGWLLIVGPIVILSAFLGWPNAETAQEELQELAKNPTLSIALGGLFMTGIALLFTGLSISSRIIAEGGAKWSSLTAVSGILFPISIAVIMTSVGLNTGAVRLYATSIENASAIHLIGYHITDVNGLAMGISFIALGIALLGRYEDLVRRIIGLLYLTIGSCHLIATFSEIDALTIVSWLGMFIVSIAFGVTVLRDQSNE